MHRIRRVTVYALLMAITLVGGVLAPQAEAVPTASRVSVATDGTQANNNSLDPDISSNAVIVAFESDATNLVSGDTLGFRDIFVRNRTTNVTERVSVSDTEVQADGNSNNPELSATGQHVVFDSGATNLAAADTNGATVDVFRRDRTNGTTILVSQSSGGAAGGANSTDPFVNGSGRFVAFTSAATNLGTAADADPATDVFLRDIDGNATTLVSVSDTEAQPPGADTAWGVSDDGNLILFDSVAAGLTTNDDNVLADVFVRDRAAASGGSTSLISVATDGTAGNGASSAASLSADGRFVAFQSAASDLVANDTNAATAATDVFVRDRVAGTTTRVSVDSAGVQANGASTEPTVSPDGRLVGFTSAATNLIAGDTNGVADVFVHDRVTGKTSRVSEGSQLNAASGTPSLAATTTPFATFTSAATNAVTGDTNGFTDVFARASLEARGYLILDDVGGFFTFGDARFFGSVPGLRNAGVNIGAAEVIDMATTRTGLGYLALDDVGGIFSFGDSVFRGSVPGLRAAGTCACPAGSIDIAMTSTGLGYFVLDDQGGIFTFGDATFRGSLPSLRASGVNIGPARAIDIAVTPTGNGYWILDEVGGVFTFGDAAFFGSVPALRASGANIGSAPGIRFEGTPSGNGYLVLDGAGGIFTFGDAAFQGSIPGLRAAGTVVGPAFGVDFALTPSGGGYHILDGQGGIFTFGDATFFGSVPALRQAGVNIGPAPSIRIDTVA